MTEPMYAWDCDNDHHGFECGRIPCGCDCHRDDSAAVIECVRCGTQWSGELPVRCPECHAITEADES